MVCSRTLADLVQPVVQPQPGVGRGEHVEQAVPGGRPSSVPAELVEVDPAQVAHRGADVPAVHVGTGPHRAGGRHPDRTAPLLAGALEQVAGGDARPAPGPPVSRSSVARP